MQDKEEAIRACDQATIQKNQIENKLIGGFIPILNAKKARIRELTEQIQKGKGKSVQPEHHEEMDEESEVDYKSAQEDTDILESQSPVKSRKKTSTGKEPVKEKPVPILLHATPEQELRVRKRHRKTGKSIEEPEEHPKAQFKKPQKKKPSDEDEDADFDSLLRGL